MANLKKEELKRAKADQKYWKEEIGDPLGLILVGWSYRSSATFRDKEGNCVQIESWFATKIIDMIESYLEREP